MRKIAGGVIFALLVIPGRDEVASPESITTTGS
jgi:hypothetical protein